MEMSLSLAIQIISEKVNGSPTELTTQEFQDLLYPIHTPKQ